jgi:hypothetical protein
MLTQIAPRGSNKRGDRSRSSPTVSGVLIKLLLVGTDTEPNDMHLLDGQKIGKLMRDSRENKLK